LPEAQLIDIRNAITFLQGEPGVDPARIGVWGTGVSAGHVVALAAPDPRVTAGLAVAPPMAGLADVSTSFDDLTIPGGSVAFDDVTSLRGFVGLRLASTMTYPTFRMQPSIYLKVWDEFDGETTTTLNNPGLAVTTQDDFSGAFADVGGQLNVYSDGGLTAFVNAGYKWKSDYNATTVNIGFRYQF